MIGFTPESLFCIAHDLGMLRNWRGGVVRIELLKVDLILRDESGPACAALRYRITPDINESTQTPTLDSERPRKEGSD